jgi:16S rRNA C967 or C1407 C5-methylase (RsmB/RsmF family)/NOL1/NOP2/fmu family ribosome biogenesis protein
MFSVPELFETAMKEKLGENYPDFLTSLQQTAPVSIRVNPKKNTALNTSEQVPWTRHGFYLAARPVFTLDPLFHAGVYYVQEASSMFLEQVFTQLIDTTQTLNVLDVSAAPGGKSTHILSLLNESSLLVSNEVIRSRASILAENLTKWGWPNSLVTNNDPEDFKSLPGFFDILVVDAPCSGEGLFRKDNVSMNEWSPQNIALCSSRQKRILADLWPCLKEDGILIYSTCTYNREENEENLKWLHDQQSVEFLQLKLENHWGVEEVVDGKIIGYRFFPHRVKGEGFFLSVVRKKEDSGSSPIRSKKKLTSLSSKTVEKIKPWLKHPDRNSFFQHNEFIYFLPEQKINEISFLLQHLKLVQLGTTMATMKHDKLIPEHASAVSTELNTDGFDKFPLTIDEALQYLRRETFQVNDLPKGFQLVTIDDIPLGWINSLGNRFNNLYPVEWRIRMAPGEQGTSLSRKNDHTNA